MPRSIVTTTPLLRLALVAAIAVPALGTAFQAQTPALMPGNGTLYIGGYPNSIWVIDEAKAKVVETIPLHNRTAKGNRDRGIGNILVHKKSA